MIIGDLDGGRLTDLSGLFPGLVLTGDRGSAGRDRGGRDGLPSDQRVRRTRRAGRSYYGPSAHKREVWAGEAVSGQGGGTRGITPNVSRGLRVIPRHG